MHGLDPIVINLEVRSTTTDGETCTLSMTTSATGEFLLSHQMKSYSIGQWLKSVYLGFHHLQKFVPSNTQNISGESAKLKPLDPPRNGSPIGWMSSTSLSRNV